MDIFLEGDFPSGVGDCKHHCRPTCHPMRGVGGMSEYGCRHEAWPQNRLGDFVPLVDCGGEMAKCEIPARLIKMMIRGRRVRIKNAKEKAVQYEREVDDLLALLGNKPSREVAR